MTRRTSRTLIGFLSVTTIAGVSVYAVSHRGKAAAPAPTVSHNSPAQPGSPLLSADTSATPAAPVPQPTLALGSATTKPVVTFGAPVDPKLGAHPADAKLASAVEPATKGNIADGKAKIDAGDVLAGRKVLNDALVGGTLSDADAETAKKMISDANKEIIFSTKRFSEDPLQGTHNVAPGERLQKIAFGESLNPELLLTINGISDARRLRAGATIKTLQGPFHCVVTKHAFTMDLYLGSPGEKGAQYVESFKVGLGREGSTPSGTWMVTDRVPNPKYYSPRGEGTVEAGDPKNPLGKFWLALTGTDGNAVGKQSYGIHGTIDPDSIGKMASMGCIRMRNEDVAQVFDLLVKDKSVVVVKD